MVDRIGRKVLTQVLVSRRQIVIRDRRKQMVQRMEADRKRKKQPCEKIALGIVATIRNVLGHAHLITMAFKVMICEKSHLIRG